MKLAILLPTIALGFVTNLSLASSQSETEALQSKLATLENDLAVLRKELSAVANKSKTASEDSEAQLDKAVENELNVKWKGAPEIKSGDGWSVKARGRMLFDVASLSSVPSSIDIPGEGFSNEARRMRLGIQGDMPGGFGYKLEVDFAGGSELTDAYLSYERGSLEYIVGQHNNFQGLSELTSSNNDSFIERSAFTDAFGFKRKLGISATYKLDDLQFQGGIFTDNLDDLDDGNNTHSIDARIVYAPKVNNKQFHLGASFHARDLGDSTDTLRYRQRPLVHSVDTRFINTGNISAATDEQSHGLEAAIVSGRFHAIAEAHWVTVKRSDTSNPTFSGSAVELGYFLTNDKRSFKGGTFSSVKVSNPIDQGGIGAWQVNVKVDNLDLSDGNILGGKQDAYMASLIWTPINNARFLLNYGHLSYSGVADIVEGAPNDFSVNVVGLRAQVSF